MNWISVNDRLPPAGKQNTGVPVIVWPYYDHATQEKRVERAMYGRRVTVEPNFYLYGSLDGLTSVTHWMPMPEPPEK